MSRSGIVLRWHCKPNVVREGGVETETEIKTDGEIHRKEVPGKDV